MVKKAFLIVIIVTGLCFSQLSQSQEIKPEEKIIANSPDELREFFLKTATNFFNRVGIRQPRRYLYWKEYSKSLPRKGEFETSSEFEKRITDWKAEKGIDINALCKATNLFPLIPGEYRADEGKFLGITLQFNPTSIGFDEIYAGIGFGAVGHGRGTAIEPSLVFKPHGIFFRYVPCEREKAIKYRQNNESLRCDIVFYLDYWPDIFTYGGVFYHRFEAMILNIKIYSLDTGDTIIQEDRMRPAKQWWRRR